MRKHANPKLEAYRSGLSGKRAAALGFGRSNVPLARFLAEAGADVTVFDRGDAESFAAEAEPLKAAGVSFCFGSGYLSKLVGFDIIYRTPGIRPDIPELEAERARGAIITSEMEAFLALCPCPYICVTGSDGKTTTSTLVSLMLKELGVKCHLGGNIGKPLLPEIDGISADDAVVVELSSFQLMDMRPSPDVAVITNISPNHLDVHKSFAEYAEAKKNVFVGQKTDGLCVLNYDNEMTRALAPLTPGRVAFFSRKSDLGGGICGACGDSRIGGGVEGGGVDGGADGDAEMAGRFDGGFAAAYVAADGSIILRRPGEKQTRVMSASDIRLVGAHNLENVLAAACATAFLGAPRPARAIQNVTPGVTPDATSGVGADAIPGAIAKTAITFGGVEHRMEFVRELDGIRYYNDSIATSPARANACLDAFDGNVVLIAGGKDKNLDYKPFAERVVLRAKALVLCGQTSEKIIKALEARAIATHDAAPPALIESHTLASAPTQAALTPAQTRAIPIPVVVCDSYEDALSAARDFAKPGDAVVLSPASASFDRFKNFEERGTLFKRLVNNLGARNGAASNGGY